MCSVMPSSLGVKRYPLVGVLSVVPLQVSIGIPLGVTSNPETLCIVKRNEKQCFTSSQNNRQGRTHR